MKEFLKVLWANKVSTLVLVGVVMVLTGIADLVGIPNVDFGAGFVFGFLILFVLAIIKIAKK